MRTDDVIIIIVMVLAICALAGAGLIGAWAESHEDNIAWKKAQLQEKFNNIDPNDYITHEKQMAKVQRTLDYLKDWGWRGYR